MDIIQVLPDTHPETASISSIHAIYLLTGIVVTLETEWGLGGSGLSAVDPGTLFK